MSRHLILYSTLAALLASGIMSQGHMTMDETTMAMNNNGMDHGSMDHGSMDHGSMDHGSMHNDSMDHGSMNHSTMDHGSMDHSSMDHGPMDHGSMDHSSMDHGSMDHGSMDHGSMDHGSMDMHNGSMDMHGMQMYFHAGYEEYVLFKECFTKSSGAMVGACFAIFFLAVLYEGLKFLRETLLQKSLSSRKPGVYHVDAYKAGSSQEHINPNEINLSVLNRILSGSHFVQTGLHMVQVFISYCLMLVFMTYNVWLCVAVILGAGVGYFCFGWKRAVVVDSNEHCH